MSALSFMQEVSGSIPWADYLCDSVDVPTSSRPVISVDEFTQYHPRNVGMSKNYPAKFSKYIYDGFGSL